MTLWIKSLTNVEPQHLSKANELASRRAQLEARLDQCLEEEAALFMEMYHSGNWSRQQMMTALGAGMSNEVVNKLPVIMPRQRRAIVGAKVAA